ncbi:MAG: prepilin-type N-terminal cleavage/methylation domain-containing protein [Phycisphaerales bacterium]|jgi:prepilin-type N-terminal cleavage/methylation domain-containing protein|nr:prepilin-type N-terminal cleavage/methylation domain-containing protein [Phycisphaerales bacterium]
MKTKKRGFTLVELMVVVAIIALLMGLLLPALSSAMATARAKKDSANLRGLGQGMASYGSDYNGSWCVPGELWRNPVQVEGMGNVCMIGRGDPNFTYNTTDNLASAMIAQNYHTVEIHVSPCENNPDIGVKGEIPENGNIVAYDHSDWDPSNCSYWDQQFEARLNGNASHTSYANQCLMGDRLISWNDTAKSSNAVYCLRGTEDGVVTDMEEGSGEFTRSPVLDFMGPSGAYHANILWGDISIENIQNFYPANSQYEERTTGYTNGIKKDNIFRAEFAGAPDANGNPSNLLSGDNFLSYSYLAGNPSFPNILLTHDELYD